MSYLPPPPPPPPPPPTSGGLVPVGLGTRFGAKAIDYLVLAVPGVILAVTVGGAATTTTEVSFTFDTADYAVSILTTILGFGYFTLLESTRGQTLGKVVLGIKVVGADGHPPSATVAARRNLWVVVPVVPFLGDIAQLVLVIVIAVTINSGAFHRGWHDEFAGGTAVVRT